MKSTWYLLLLPLLASATPIGKGNNQALVNAIKDHAFCKVNIAIVQGLHKDPLGSSYCSSFLDIPMTTV